MTGKTQTHYEFFLNELADELNRQTPGDSHGSSSDGSFSHIKVHRFHLLFDRKGNIERLVFHTKDGLPTHWPMREALLK